MAARQIVPIIVKHSINITESMPMIYRDSAPPPADPEIILKHMDMAGIRAYVGYASVRKWEIKDLALRHEVHRVYNDWMTELNTVHPDRLLMLPIMPVFDPEATLVELERVKNWAAKQSNCLSLIWRKRYGKNAGILSGRLMKTAT